MGIKKIITIILIMVSLLIAALLIVINANFFKEISYVSPESKEKPAAEEEPELNYAIPSTVIPTGQITETVITGIIEKRKALEEQELEAERVRNANRAEAFARQKQLEASLLSAESEGSKKTAASPSPQKDTEPPSAEEMKAMEEKGIISF